MKSAIFNGYTVKLVESLQDIEEIKGNLDKRVMVGVDTETTGLSYAEDFPSGGVYFMW